jgi:PAS domain S-box-containing protein
MRRAGKPIGVLSIQSYTPGAYNQEDLLTLQALADYCAGALERFRTEQALELREDLNRTILATAMDGFFTLDFSVDRGGAIVDVNDAYCRLVGYRRDELLQMRIADLEAAESSEEIARHKAKIMSTGADRFETRHAGRQRRARVWLRAGHHDAQAGGAGKGSLPNLGNQTQCRENGRGGGQSHLCHR